MLHFSFGAGTSLPGAPRPGRRPAPGGRRAARRASSSRARIAGGSTRRTASSTSPGMGGWGTYTLADGCFQRVRYTGDPVQLPIALPRPSRTASSSRSPGRSIAPWPRRPKSHFAQAWNYRYGPAYGSPELSPRHPGMPGHDPLADPVGHRPRRRPDALPRDPRPAARQPAPPAPAGRRRPAARPLRHGPQARGPLHRLPRLSPGRQDDRRPPDPGRPGRPGQEGRPEPVAKADPRRPRRSTSRPART